MTGKTQAPYGTWQSPITPELISGSSIRYSGAVIDGDDVYWLEGRPQEQGRTAIVRWRDGRCEDILPEHCNVRSRVHEYGGGAMAVGGGHIWFVNNADQQIYHMVATSAGKPDIRQLTRADGCRFADIVIDGRHDCLYAIRESVSHGAGAEPVNELVRINCTNGETAVLAGGDDFYSAPALSPDGRHLCWLSWSHPDMPWDGTAMWLADIADDGNFFNMRPIIAQAGQAVFQPCWSPAGRLYFINDPAGWWQLYRLNDLNDTDTIERICCHEAELGLPLWQFGMKTCAFQNEQRIMATLCEQGLWRLVSICTHTGQIETLSTPYNHFSAIVADRQKAVVIAAGPTSADEVACIDLHTGTINRCNEAGATELSDDWFSTAQPVSYPTTDNDTAHGFYYAPKNPDTQGPPGQLPPLLVMTHGGPTGAASASLELRTQYWTSRGFAVLDVNYRGSTGYGRAYREKLKGHWGIYDVDDVVAGAHYLSEQRQVDGARMAIRGSSAGGFTTLAALTFAETFAAGCSLYGIGDLESLVADTHKFESRYLDSLIGRYPQQRDTYIQRSPLSHVERLSCPVLFMQGAEDKVVPPQQAEKMAAALKAKGIDVELLIFAGEQHGFRKADTIRRALISELAFYCRILDLQK